MYKLSSLEWWGEFNCYCMVPHTHAIGELKTIMEVENKMFRKKPFDIVFIEW